MPDTLNDADIRTLLVEDAGEGGEVVSKLGGMLAGDGNTKGEEDAIGDTASGGGEGEEDVEDDPMVMVSFDSLTRSMVASGSARKDQSMAVDVGL